MMMMMKHKRPNILLEVLVIPVDRCIISKVKSLQITARTVNAIHKQERKKRTNEASGAESQR